MAGSESDLVHSLSRDDSNNVNSNWNQRGRGPRHPPISKSHSDWGLILPPSSEALPSHNIDFQERSKHNSNLRIHPSGLHEHVYSQPDLTFSKSQFNPNNYYPPSTPPSSSSHESFRVC